MAHLENSRLNPQKKHKKPRVEWADPDIPEWEGTPQAEGRSHRRAGLVDAALEGVGGASNYTEAELEVAKAALRKAIR
jgi:hypothetical protein